MVSADAAGGDPPPVPPAPVAVGWSAGPTRRFRSALVTVLAMTVLGIPFGLLWYALAPSVPVVRTEHGAELTAHAPEEFIAADGWFSLLGFGLGLVAAIVAWVFLHRLRGPVGLIAMGIGGLGCATVAWALGSRIGLSGYRRDLDAAPVGQVLHQPPDLQGGGFELLFGVVPAVQGAFLAPAFGAVLTYTMLAGWSRYPSLRAEPESRSDVEAPADAPPVSSGSPAPPSPAAGPAPPAPGAAAPPPD